VNVPSDGRRRTTTADQRRTRVVEMVVLGEDVAAISEAVKLSNRHVRRILAEDDIRRQVRELETERLRAVARKASALGSSAVEVLKTIATDAGQPAPARVSAARALLDTMIKVGELAELAERVQALESSISKGDGPWRPRAV
jgi:hypothetical protein